MAPGTRVTHSRYPLLESATIQEHMTESAAFAVVGLRPMPLRSEIICRETQVVPKQKDFSGLFCNF